MALRVAGLNEHGPRVRPDYARVGTIRAAEDPSQPWQGLWEELFGKSGWMPTAAGVKNAFKVGYHVVDWTKYFSEEPLPVEMLNFRGAMKDCKNAFGLTELPGKAKKAAGSVLAFLHGPTPVVDRDRNPVQDSAGQRVRTNYIGLGYKALLDVAGVVSPLNDSAEFINARVAPIASETLKELGQLNAAALFFSMADSAVKDLRAIWRATRILCPSLQSGANYIGDCFGYESSSAVDDIDDDELPALRLEARVVLELQLLDLAKCVSYIGLAAIALISAFVVPVANAAFWILVCSTSALAFTIISEFDQRYHRRANRVYPDLPGMGQLNVIRLPEYAAMPSAGGSGQAREGGRNVNLPRGVFAPNGAESEPENDELEQL